MQSKYGGKVEVVAVADIGTDDLTEAVKGMFCRRLDQDLSLYPDIFFLSPGIDAVIHVAAGLPVKQDADAMYNVRNTFNLTSGFEIRSLISFLLFLECHKWCYERPETRRTCENTQNSHHKQLCDCRKLQ